MFKHKNALAALMAVVMLLSLTACGGKKTEQTARRIALRFRSLLLFLDSRNLKHTGSHSHTSGNRSKNVADNRCGGD